VQFPGFIQAYVDMNWLYFSFLLFVFTCTVILVASRFTPPASTEQLAGLTYKSISSQQLAVDRESYGFWEIFHTVVVVGIIVGIYIFFW
jgi:SSS family solute:Na+ symporter